jgi:hypothetical protein
MQIKSRFKTFHHHLMELNIESYLVVQGTGNISREWNSKTSRIWNPETSGSVDKPKLRVMW